MMHIPVQVHGENLSQWHQSCINLFLSSQHSLFVGSHVDTTLSVSRKEQFYLGYFLKCHT
jgi:hypothetical protein